MKSLKSYLPWISIFEKHLKVLFQTRKFIKYIEVIFNYNNSLS
jgi:hypothetical protein